jgi:hypothetical protein
LHKKLIEENKYINKDDIIEFKKKFNETFEKSLEEENEIREITDLVNYEQNKIKNYS